MYFIMTARIVFLFETRVEYWLVLVNFVQLLFTLTQTVNVFSLCIWFTVNNWSLVTYNSLVDGHNRFNWLLSDHYCARLVLAVPTSSIYNYRILVHHYPSHYLWMYLYKFSALYASLEHVLKFELPHNPDVSCLDESWHVVRAETSNLLSVLDGLESFFEIVIELIKRQAWVSDLCAGSVEVSYNVDVSISSLFFEEPLRRDFLRIMQDLVLKFSQSKEIQAFVLVVGPDHLWKNSTLEVNRLL